MKLQKILYMINKLNNSVQFRLLILVMLSKKLTMTQKLMKRRYFIINMLNILLLKDLKS